MCRERLSMEVDRKLLDQMEVVAMRGHPWHRTAAGDFPAGTTGIVCGSGSLTANPDPASATAVLQPAK
jgi:hypothetical protein